MDRNFLSTGTAKAIRGLYSPSLFSDKHQQQSHVGQRHKPQLLVGTYSPPGEPQFPATLLSSRFPSQNVQNLRYPPNQKLSQLGIVSTVVSRASPYGPFIVELFPAAFLRTPELIIAPMPYVTARTRSRRSLRCTVHPKVDSGPTGRICTYFDCHGLLPIKISEKGISESPTFYLVSSRIDGLLFLVHSGLQNQMCTLEGLLTEAPR